MPVASSELEEDCIQSPEKEVVKPGVESSVTVKAPDLSPTAWRFPLLRENVDDGWGLLPVTCTSKEGVPGQDPPPDTTQDFLINKVPVDGFPDVPPVLGTPLLTLFADLWLHEFDMGL